MSTTDFTRAVQWVMQDSDVARRYPDGLTPGDVLQEVWDKFPGEFRLCTVIDAADELQALYGR